MAWVDGGLVGTANSKTSGDTLVITTSASLSANDHLIVSIAKDNVSTVDAETSEVVSVSAGSESLSKLYERSNGQGSSGSGAVVSLWYKKMAGGLSSGSSITITFSSSITAKAAVAYKFTSDDPNAVGFMDLSPSLIATDNADPQNIATSSGLSTSQNHLVLHALAGEHPTATFSTLGSFTLAGQDGTSGGGSASNMSAGLLFSLQNPGGGGTLSSNPTWDSGDHIQIMVVLLELTWSLERFSSISNSTDTWAFSASQAGDFWIIATIANEGETCSGGTGWTEQGSTSLSNITIQLFTHTDSGGETSHTLSFTGTPTFRIVGARYRKTQIAQGDIGLIDYSFKTSASATVNHSTNLLSSVPAHSEVQALVVGRNASPATWTEVTPSEWDINFNGNVTPGAPENYGYCQVNSIVSLFASAADDYQCEVTATNAAEQINVIYSLNIAEPVVSANLIASSTTVFNPTVNAGLVADFLAAATTVYAPTVQGGISGGTARSFAVIVA